MAEKPAHRTPAGLGSAGKAAFKRLVATLPPGWAFDARELEILTEACKTRDLIDALEKAVTEHGAIVGGSTKQKRVNPAYAEIRQMRALYAQLLGKLELADNPTAAAGEAKPQTAASKHASTAARARWGTQGRRAAGQGRMDV